jgi:hypothetical protein
VIRPLRRVHRVVFTVLVVVLPVLLGAALLARPRNATPLHETDSAWSIRVERPDLIVDRPASTPEVLAYVDADPSATGPGPASRLLGALAGSRTTFVLPDHARGQVLLYSPALQRTLARQALP